MLLSAAAAFAAMDHKPDHAATLWAAAGRARASTGLDETPTAGRLRARWHAQALADSGDQLRWDEAWRCGTELTPQDALALAEHVLG
jgi:hypothetical protein